VYLVPLCVGYRQVDLSISEKKLALDKKIRNLIENLTSLFASSQRIVLSRNALLASDSKRCPWHSKAVILTCGTKNIWLGQVVVLDCGACPGKLGAGVRALGLVRRPGWLQPVEKSGVVVKEHSSSRNQGSNLLSYREHKTDWNFSSELRLRLTKTSAELIRYLDLKQEITMATG